MILQQVETEILVTNFHLNFFFFKEEKKIEQLKKYL